MKMYKFDSNETENNLLGLNTFLGNEDGFNVGYVFFKDNERNQSGKQTQM